MRCYYIEVAPDEMTLLTPPVRYTVLAANELDARIIAFCLDGGFQPGLEEMEEGHIELVKMYTNVIGHCNA